jgi:O-antigen/teichoic acid export membrane protein
MPYKDRLIALLRRSERYTKTDMVYLFSSGWWSNLGTLSVSFGSLALYTVFGHLVPKDVYGTYQYLLSLGAIVGAFTLTGMNTAVTRAVAQGYEGAMARSVRIQLQWGALPLLGAWCMGGYYLLHGNATLGWGLFLIGVFVPLNSTLNTYGAFLGGKKDFRRGFLYSLWWNVPYYAAVAVAAVFFKSALILLAANLVSQGAGLMVAYWRTRRVYRPNAEVGEGTLRYGSHLSAMGLFGVIVAQIDGVLAFQYLGPASLALYSFATAIPDRLGGLFKFLPAAALPKLVNKAPGEVRETLGKRLLLVTAAAGALALIYIAGAHTFFAILFPQYLASVPYSQAYALMLLVSVSTSVISAALSATADIRSLYAFNTISPVASLGFLVAGVALFGLWGLIAARLLSALFTLALGLALYWRSA